MFSGKSEIGFLNNLAVFISGVSILICAIFVIHIQKECDEMRQIVDGDMVLLQRQSDQIWSELSEISTKNPGDSRRRRQISRSFFTSISSKGKYKGYPAIPIVLGSKTVNGQPIQHVATQVIKTPDPLEFARSNGYPQDFETDNDDGTDYSEERNIESNNEAANAAVEEAESYTAQEYGYGEDAFDEERSPTPRYGASDEDEIQKGTEAPTREVTRSKNMNPQPYPPPSPKERPWIRRPPPINRQKSTTSERVETSQTAPPRNPTCNCECKPRTDCPVGPPGPRGPKGTDGEMGENGSAGRAGLDADDVHAQVSQLANCVQCPPGEPGEEGSPGKMGPRGMRGVQGKAGCPGRPGSPGCPGIHGPPGLQGPLGIVGQRGTQGLNGTAGEGVQGEKGVRGQRGKPGDQGEPGNDGAEGELGPEGSTGSEGVPGEDGAPGYQGELGENGVPGFDADYCPCPRRLITREQILRQLV